jgi:ABC-type multidrug transport system ATPase subunit
MNVIETHQLTKRYRTQLAVDAISFDVEEGQVFGFLGPNGSGKTTTIGMLLGIISANAGDVRLFERYGRAELHVARRRIGATLETPNFYPYMSGRDNLRIVANVKGVAHRRIDEVLDLVGLAARRKDRFAAYSLGMKQRLAIAATMIGNPELVILDEPANGLDPEGMREIREIIGRLADQGKTIFLSSHLLWEVERTCTHVAVIKKGSIVRQASVDELVGSGVVVGLTAPDPDALALAVGEYPGTSAVRADGRDVVADLRDDDLASLNRFLAGRGIWVSHLARRRRSLEDAFMELTGTSDTMHELAVPAVEDVA